MSLPIRILQAFETGTIFRVREEFQIERTHWGRPETFAGKDFSGVFPCIEIVFQRNRWPFDGWTILDLPANPVFVSRENGINHAVVKLALEALLKVFCNCIPGLCCPFGLHSMRNCPNQNGRQKGRSLTSSSLAT